jgi:hypothetical protein
MRRVAINHVTRRRGAIAGVVVMAWLLLLVLLHDWIGESLESRDANTFAAIAVGFAVAAAVLLPRRGGTSVRRGTGPR